MRAATLTIAVLVALLATGASATPGPGGWDNLGTGATPTTPALNGAVYALNAAAPGLVYVGGAFTDAAGIADADYIARWNGTKWAALGAPPLNGSVNAIAYFGGKVYVGGVFTNAGGNPNADFLAVWDGTKWGTVCNATGSAITATVFALQVVGSTLYVGGAFANGAGIVSADSLLACDLNTGAASSTVRADGDMNGVVTALTADSNGTLYAGGTFSNLEGIAAADKVASYSSGVWHALGSGPGPGGGALDSNVRSLAAHGTDVYVGTDTVNVAGIAQADHVAKWNGSAWSALSANTAGTDGWFPAAAFINSLTTSGSLLFAGGSFQGADGKPVASFIAYFDGTVWRPVGSNGAGGAPLNGNVTALATFAGNVYAGGTFTNGGGDVLARDIASYPLAVLTAPAGTPTGTQTGTVLLNGRAFTGGPIPFGSTLDVTHGTLTLTTDTGVVTVYGNGVLAAFVLLRGTDIGKPIVEFRLTSGNFAVCNRKLAAVTANKPPSKVIRQLWAKGKGKFRTRGRYASATVRGTTWLTADRCDGTLTRVNQGIVQVADFTLKKKFLVHAGASHLAKKP